MNYNLILIILGSLLADMLLHSCNHQNRQAGADENKTEAVAAIVDSSALIEVEDFVDTASTIDSCVICYLRAYEVKFTVKFITNKKSADSYICQLSMPEENTPIVDLERGAGDYIIRSVDSLFVRKLVPPIISEQCDSDIIVAGDFPQISFKIFIGGRYIYKEFVFAEKYGNYTYEYSDCFYDLCRMICFNSRNYISEIFYKDGRANPIVPYRYGCVSEKVLFDKVDDAYLMVEQMPEFPGGDEVLRNWVHENIRYPVASRDRGLQGRVVVQFVVTKKGSIGRVKIIRSISQELDREAVRVVKRLPKFKPGKHLGKAVDVWYTLPVTFELDNSAK